jgi:anthraniloyl-CoA monooxygenase
MKIAIVGGGPGGLYFAALMKQLDASHDVTLWERNAASDTFGFGVVFSDETLGGIGNADPVVAEYMSRKELLELLQRRCFELGVDVRFSTLAPPIRELEAGYDLVLASDGVNSLIRATYADSFRPNLDPRANKFMWLGHRRSGPGRGRGFPQGHCLVQADHAGPEPALHPAGGQGGHCRRAGRPHRRALRPHP